MSDRIAIMREGQFEQVGTPEEIYERPRTRFAAGFIGQTNLIEMDVAGARADGLTLRYGGVELPARPADFPVKPGEKVAVSLRTERIGFARAPLAACALRRRSCRATTPAARCAPCSGSTPGARCWRCVKRRSAPRATSASASI